MPRPAYILTGPQLTVKRRARELAALLNVAAIVDDDTGVTCSTPQPGLLTLTHSDPELPAGAVQFTVADAAGLDALIETLRRAHGGGMVDIPAFLRKHGIEEPTA